MRIENAADIAGLASHYKSSCSMLVANVQQRRSSSSSAASYLGALRAFCASSSVVIRTRNQRARPERTRGVGVNGGSIMYEAEIAASISASE